MKEIITAIDICVDANADTMYLSGEPWEILREWYEDMLNVDMWWHPPRTNTYEFSRVHHNVIEVYRVATNKFLLQIIHKL